MKNSTDWNKHNGVGATLLENWVEERATEPFIKHERQLGTKIDRHGHQNILSVVNARQLETTQRESYKEPKQNGYLSRQGKLRELLEKKWKEEIKADYSHKDIYPNIEYLGKTRPSQEQLEFYKVPITFWSEHALMNDGATMCSIQHEQFESMKADNSLLFGKHTDFSTPIEEYIKNVHK